MVASPSTQVETLSSQWLVATVTCSIDFLRIDDSWCADPHGGIYLQTRICIYTVIPEMTQSAPPSRRARSAFATASRALKIRERTVPMGHPIDLAISS